MRRMAALAAGVCAALAASSCTQEPGAIFYVDGSSRSASDGNAGSEAAPWKTIQHAADQAEPGDIIYVKAGIYKPFEIEVSGTAGNHITFAAYPGHEHEVIVDGSGTKVRGVIEAHGQSYLTISGFRVQNAPTDAITIEGSPAGSRDIHILNNQIENTGNAGIYTAGLIMGGTHDVGEYRLFDVLIEGNEVTKTNVGNGGNEAISVGGGLDGFVIRKNWVHDSEQYGIDVKFGAIKGEISGNLIHGIEKHGIYLDSNSRTVAHIEIFGNEIWGNNNGIALARESTRFPKKPNLFDIGIHDNIVRDNAKYGIMAYRHKNDIGTGEFSGVRIYNNTIIGNDIHGIHLKGIGDYAEDFVIAGNKMSGNGKDILNEIGAIIGE
jgi:Right handed beta helix region